jgi:transposase
MGIHPSTYYRWKRQLDRHGPEILRPRERRTPRMANQTSVLVEQRVVAFALGHPGFGPARIAAELARPKWGAIQLSTNGVWRVLGRHGISTRAKRYGLVAGYAAPLAPERPHPPPERHLQVDYPGELVQLDCFCIGRLSGTKGTVWQYTAIDVASAYTWASLQVTRRNPSAVWTSALARIVAADLAARGWRLERVMSDNASEFRSTTFGQTIAASTPATASSALADLKPTAVSNGCSRPSWTSARRRPLPATSSPSRPACGSTSSAISATTTPNAPTPADGPRAGRQRRSSGRPSYGTRTADASPQLGDRTHYRASR